jgi:hypothetical protein
MRSTKAPYDTFYRFPYFLIASIDTFERGLIPRYLEPGVKLFSKTVGADSIVHGDGASTAYQTHQYPFATIGPLVSHVFPHFAICNTAQKFAKTEGALDKFLKSAIGVLKAHTDLDEEAVEELLNKIKQLHASWISFKPDPNTTAADENPSDDERDEPDYLGVGEPLPVLTQTSVRAEKIKKPRKAAAKSQSSRTGGPSRTS